MATLQNEKNMLWLDLEMTGLDPVQQTIIEIATLITDADLNIVAEGPSIVIGHDQKILDNMEDWSLKTHKKSGLFQKATQSKITMQQAEDESLAFISLYCLPQKSPLCGNSIGHDRRFIERYMPKLFAYLHYRNIDVSTIKELAKRWYHTNGSVGPTKKTRHRALDDIKESIDELKFYREHYFIKR